MSTTKDPTAPVSGQPDSRQYREKRKERITLNMSMVDVMMAMSDGNPGAVTVCARVLKEGAAIDPDDWAQGLSTLLALDSMGIYGSRIWVLYKYVCKQSLKAMIAVTRAHQLGQLAGCTEAAINHAIDSDGNTSLDPDAIVAAVQKELPNFGK